MPHAMPLISTLAAAIALSLVLGLVAIRFRLPPLVGYLLAGVLIGPFTPGYVADVGLATQLAEIGVMLLMFGVGLHFSLRDLLEVKRIALPGAVVQMGVATVLGWGLGRLWGWSDGASVLFGICLSVASTVVLLRALEARGALTSANGRIAVGWLVVEDLAMVLVLVLLPGLAAVLGSGSVPSTSAAPAAPERSLWMTLGQTLLALAAFVALMVVVGRRTLPWALWQVSRTGSRELFTLSVIGLALSIAYGASLLFGVSVALGAFFAGLVLRESSFAQRAAEESLPFRDAFAVLFFVSVGMLFDPRVLVDEPLKVLAVALVVMVGKSLAAAALVLLMRYPLNTALTVSVSLAQIGEFSFILAGLAASLGILPLEAKSLIVAGALISMALNPALFSLIEPLRAWILKKSALARRFEARDDPLAELPRDTDAKRLAHQVVLVGHGQIGRVVAQSLREGGIPFVAVDLQRERVESLRAEGASAVAGDAAEPLVLVQAHVARARLMVVTVTESTAVRAMIRTARTLNPEIAVLVCAPNFEEAELLRQEGADAVVHPQAAMAAQLRDWVLARWAAS
jgi:monovalent cation:H+ antiporter-2, CPA2 family